jgi:beta-mannanase
MYIFEYNKRRNQMDISEKINEVIDQKIQNGEIKKLISESIEAGIESGIKEVLETYSSMAREDTIKILKDKIASDVFKDLY